MPRSSHFHLAGRNLVPSCHRLLLPVLTISLLSISACRQKTLTTNASLANPTPFSIYQGTGNIGEERGGRACFVYGKEEHCWNAGDGFSEVKAEPIELPSGGRLVLVSALSMGGSDGTISLALLEERNRQPVNLLPHVEISSSNDGEWDHWQIGDLSPMPVIVTADPVWGDGETRSSTHQYRIEAYTYEDKSSTYIQRFQYQSSRKYSGGRDVITLEKPTILTRLGKVPRK